MMDERRAGGLQVATEIALIAVTLATAYSFRRLFVDDSFFVQVALAALASHLLALATRRIGWGIGRSALVSVGGLILAVTWIEYFDTTTFLLPTGATLDALRVDSDQAWMVFQDVVAPAPVEVGFVIALAVGVWLSAFLADWAAFRLWSPVEAVVPAAALFLFASLLGADESRVLSTALFLVAVLAFQLLHYVTKQLGSRHWINADAEEGGRSLLAGGAVMAALAVVVAVLIGPALPGAEDPAVIEWRDIGDDTPARVTVSPMVSIQSQLIDQPDVEVFTVQAEQPAYWRLTSLDEFDGQIWKSSGSFEDVDGELPTDRTVETATATFTQDFTIEALEALWLPAAFQPVSIDAPDADVVYEVDSATLIVSNERSTSDGLTYEVESAIPAPDPAQLTTTGEPPAPVADRFLRLPDDYSPELRTQAEALTTGAPDDYQRALALQNYFRTEFVYDDQVDLAHDINSIEEFLTARRGYCEQFAGTFAAFARSIGIPARVAVGFTWGDEDPEQPGLYHVNGRHAHAWPEVWLAGAGWVPFEPTPGRGNPLAEQITGVPEAQAPPPTDPNAPTTATAPTTTSSSIPLEALPVPPSTPAGETEVETEAATTDPGLAWPLRLLVVVAGAAALAAVYAAVVLGLKRLRLTRRRRAVASTADRVRLAWTEATEQLAVAGLTKRTSETHAEYVQRVLRVAGDDPPSDGSEVVDGSGIAGLGRGGLDRASLERAGLDRATLDRLATLAAAADFADLPPTDAEADEAEDASGWVAEWVTRATSLWERLRAGLDPRPLLPQRRARVVPG